MEVHGVGLHWESFRLSPSFHFLSEMNGILFFLSQLHQTSSPQRPMFSIVRIFSLTLLFPGGKSGIYWQCQTVFSYFFAFLIHLSQCVNHSKYKLLKGYLFWLPHPHSFLRWNHNLDQRLQTKARWPNPATPVCYYFTSKVGFTIMLPNSRVKQLRQRQCGTLSWKD